jgi:hypothetical protein
VTGQPPALDQFTGDERRVFVQAIAAAALGRALKQAAQPSDTSASEQPAQHADGESEAAA